MLFFGSAPSTRLAYERQPDAERMLIARPAQA